VFFLFWEAQLNVLIMAACWGFASMFCHLLLLFYCLYYLHYTCIYMYTNLYIQYTAQYLSPNIFIVRVYFRPGVHSKEVGSDLMWMRAMLVVTSSPTSSKNVHVLGMHA
jgi:hypothetical protein